MRGHQTFVNDVEACNTKHSTDIRVRQELAKIASRLSNPPALSVSERVRAIWRLIYCFMLGYEITFGQMEAVTLVASTKFSEKAIGYLACSMLLMDATNILDLLTNALRTDIRSSCESVAALGLNFLANSVTDQIIESIYCDVKHLCHFSSKCSPYIQKKALLVLIKFSRSRPDLLLSEEWTSLCQNLQPHFESGYLTALASFLLSFVQLRKISNPSLSKACCSLLYKIASSEIPLYGKYCDVPCPWLQIKLLRILKYSSPPEDAESLTSLKYYMDELFKIDDAQSDTPIKNRFLRFKSSDDKEPVHRKSSRYFLEHSVLIDATSLISVHGNLFSSVIKTKAVSRLASENLPTDIDIQYMSLHTLIHLSMTLRRTNALNSHLNRIIRQLYEPDPSLKQQALELLYIACNRQNWQLVVNELLALLKETSPGIIQEDLIIKIAVIVERFAPDYTWYIDTVFTIMQNNAASVLDEIWHRAVQILVTTNEAELQIYAAHKAFAALQNSFADENLVKLAAHILGNFGHFILDEASEIKQYNILVLHLKNISPTSQGIILGALAKLSCFSPFLQNKLGTLYANYFDSSDPDMQQRALELDKIIKMRPATMQTVLSSTSKHLAKSKLDCKLLMQAQAKKRQTMAGGLGNLEISCKDCFTSVKATTQRANPLINVDYGSSSSTGSCEKTSDSEYEGTWSTERAQSIEIDTNSSDKSLSSDSADYAPISLKSLWSLLGTTDLLTNWKRSCLESSGILLQSPCLRVHVQHDYRKKKGRLLIFVINIATTQLLITDFTIERIEGLRCKLISQSTCKQIMQPSQQIKFAILVEVQKPFRHSPKFALSYQITPKLTERVISALPCVTTSFLIPQAFNSQDFQYAWDRLSKVFDNRAQSLIQLSDDFLILVKQYAIQEILSLYVSKLNFFSQSIDSVLCGSAVVPDLDGDAKDICQGREIDNMSENQIAITRTCLIKLEIEEDKKTLLASIRSSKTNWNDAILQTISLMFLNHL